MEEITGLPILGELYEEHVPLDSELAAESEEFRALFFLVMSFFEHTREGHDNQSAFVGIAKVVPMKFTEQSVSSSTETTFTEK